MFLVATGLFAGSGSDDGQQSLQSRANPNVALSPLQVLFSRGRTFEVVDTLLVGFFEWPRLDARLDCCRVERPRLESGVPDRCVSFCWRVRCLGIVAGLLARLAENRL